MLVKPFIKWAGGKGQLLPQLRAHYPAELAAGAIRRYVEPFMGGGAVFLDVAQHYHVDDLFLCDVNPELVLAYRVVQQEPEALIDTLTRYQAEYDRREAAARKALFYQVRKSYNRQRHSVDYSRFAAPWIERAAALIFLNKTCYNGLYRVNKQGAFNVPFGRYRRPRLVDADNLRAVSRLLQRAELQVGSFETCETYVNRDTFVYFDPPYRPLTASAGFTAYSRHAFGDAEQQRLAHFYCTLARTGAKLMLSNSDPANVDPDDCFFQQLYSNFRIHRVQASRMINAHADKRGKITELLITNY